MGDLIMGVGLIGVGLSGMIAMEYARRKLPEWNARSERLRRRSIMQLHAEMTRCCGAIFECARIGDKHGMRHAYRAMRPVMRELARRERMKRTARTAM